MTSPSFLPRYRPPSGVHRGRWLPALLVLLAAAALGGLAALVLAARVYATCGGAGCPDVSRLAALRPRGAPVLLDRAGEPFARLRPEDRRRVVALDDLPSYVPQAFVAVEDKRFFAHHGVDWLRVAGAVRANLQARGFEEGFSTLTMQLARNAFRERLPGRERSLQRKLGEVRVAREIEARFDKREILELYLNEIPFGGGARGIEAAARRYFARPAAALTLPQAALLAALPKAPSDYDPRRHPERARKRRNLVLDLMAAQGRIAGPAAEAARRAPLGVVRHPGADAPPPPAPYFVQEVRRELEPRFGDRLYQRPVRIFTTLDPGLQRAAEAALEDQLRAIERGARGPFHGPRHTAAAAVGEEGTPYLQGAVLVLDPRSGDVLAWIGGRDFAQSRFDRVRLGRRQLGSAFKPFVYAAALAAGHSPAELLSDQPLTVDLGHGRVWQPENSDHRYEDRITLRQALVRSKNVATVRLARRVGIADVAYVAHLAGFDAELPRQPSLALGAAAVSPFEVARAYTPFATLGDRVEPRLVRRVETPDGRVIWRSPVERRPLLDPGLAYLVTDMLRDVVDRGTGYRVRRAGFRAPAAGKTGTSNDGRDAWFVGYTPRTVGVVWIGFDQPRRILPRATGGLLAAPVWGRMMARAARGGVGPNDWPRPADVAEYRVDPASGRILAPGCEPLEGAAGQELFLAGLTPAASCPRWPAGEPGEDEAIGAADRVSASLGDARSASGPGATTWPPPVPDEPWAEDPPNDEGSRIEIEWHREPPRRPRPSPPAPPDR